jgi:hypothetical protein
MKGMKRKIPRDFSYSVFYEQAPEGGYVAFVPALPGCHTQGETLEESERNVKESNRGVPGKSGGPRGGHSRGRAIVSGEGHGSHLCTHLINGKAPVSECAEGGPGAQTCGFIALF